MIVLIVAAVPAVVLVLVVGFVLVDAALELIADLAAKRHYSNYRGSLRS